MRTTSRASLTRAMRPALALLTLLTLCAAVALAERKEPKDALIYGTVWNADNHAVSGVLVKIQRVGDKKPKWERTSDRRGEFAVRVPMGAGDYILFTEVKVGKEKKRIEAKAHVEANERVDVSLRVPE